MDLIIERLDPEWTCYIRCPIEGCTARTFACCEDHAREGISEHIHDKH